MRLEKDALVIHKQFMKEVVMNVLVGSFAKPTEIKHDFERTTCGVMVYARDVLQHNTCMVPITGFAGTYYVIRCSKLRIFCKAYTVNAFNECETVVLGGASTTLWIPEELKNPSKKSRLLRYAIIEGDLADPLVYAETDMVYGDIISPDFLDRAKDKWSFCEMF